MYTVINNRRSTDSLGKNKTESSFGKDSIVLVGKRAGYCEMFLVELSVYLPTTLPLTLLDGHVICDGFFFSFLFKNI